MFRPTSSLRRMTSGVRDAVKAKISTRAQQDGGLLAAKGTREWKFQPAPRKRGRLYPKLVRDFSHISTHALREEGGLQKTETWNRCCFNPRPPFKRVTGNVYLMEIGQNVSIRTHPGWVTRRRDLHGVRVVISTRTFFRKVKLAPAQQPAVPTGSARTLCGKGGGHELLRPKRQKKHAYIEVRSFSSTMTYAPSLTAEPTGSTTRR